MYAIFLKLEMTSQNFATIMYFKFQIIRMGNSVIYRQTEGWTRQLYMLRIYIIKSAPRNLIEFQEILGVIKNQFKSLLLLVTELFLA